MKQVRDPYHADAGDTKTYECPTCGKRVEATSQPEACTNCGTQMTDLAVPRE